jgi:dTDP-4-dehydrorhamnose 3,5-epimerase
MKIVSEHLGGVLVLQPRTFADARGSFMETYSRRTLATLGIADEFVQDNQSHSVKSGTVRGLHLQVEPHAQGKLVRVLRGRILDVVVDVRPGSPTLHKHVTIELAASEGTQIWVPKGFAHGFCTLEPDTEVLYKVTDFYDPGTERSIRWNDPALGIRWPVTAAEATLSDKDRVAPLLAELTGRP